MPDVGRGLMRMVWHDLLFMHWKVDGDELREHLPSSLELDTWHGQAWIGIVPFRMSGVSLRWLPDVPWFSKFPELNVRTYVIGPDGQPGVWFYSLDATNPVAVRGARWLYNLQYMDAEIQFERERVCDCGCWIRYQSQRTHRGEPAADLSVEYRPIGPAYEAGCGTLLDWLTSRYSLFSADRQGRLYRGDIAHDAWKLRDAQAIIQCNSMTDGINVSLPADDPLLHFSARTKVIAGPIRRVH
ncbi:YqjF family protein [Mariniblastus fucicola]|nr:DUF2071 domain-containing protein [Mariniblastus fucicola]